MKKITSYLIAVMMVITMMPYTAFADAEAQQTAADINLEIEQYNPLYSDEDPVVEIIKGSDDIILFSEPAPISDDGEYAANNEEAISILRAGMVARKAEVVINMQIKPQEFTEEAISEKVMTIFDGALQHTGKPQEGDSLKWVYKECPMGISATGDGVNYYVTITYLPTYYTTAAQETELTAAVNSLKSELNLDGKTDYEKVKAIYDYMTANISYDYENLNDPDYTLKYTAYAALLNKTSVCQGYAALFYRMACEYGIDARMISGKSLNNIGQKENHGWNIVKLGDKYYNLDATWDSTWDSDKTTHDFFLKSNDSFENHERNTEFTTSGFNAAHPMSGTDYVPGTDSVPHEHNYGEWIIDKNATCTTAGFKHKECINCDVELVEEIPALEHKLVKHTGKAATCTAKGWKAYEKCSRCDYTTYTAIAAKGHKWESFYTIDKKATTKAAGSKSKHCATCNAAKSGSKVTISRIKKTTADTLVYNGKNRTQNVTVVNYAGKKLVKGTDFTVTYKNAKGTKVVTPKNVGTYKAVIKFKGMYSGTVTKTFKINPQETKIAKLTKNGKNQFTVKWTKKTAQVTGYQIKYSMKQNMSNAKTETVKNAKTTSKTIKQLKAKKKYYVQIRTYKTVNGTKYYSAWSAKSYVTTK